LYAELFFGVGDDR